MIRIHCPSALLPGGWAENVLIETGDDGRIAAITAGAEPGGAVRAAGPTLPGMPNLHSHAFQRAMAGLTERAGDPADSFWTWREIMYGFVAKLSPDDVEAIAAQLYLEMLKAGYTGVAEFHYLHHGPDGIPYVRRAEMAERILAASATTGIRLALLPVLYAHSGFGGLPPGSGQRRFINDPDGLLGIAADARASADPAFQSVGLALHSLRAVTAEEMRDAIAGLPPEAPIHIHIAEQVKEVEDCLAWSGLRPVEWLLANQPPDRRWCLIHATHMTEAETRGVAASGAVAGFCPTTEANLGDGILPGIEYLAAGGAYGVGSDSHITVSASDELRLMEYGQRLERRRRNLLHGPVPSVGGTLYPAAVAGGARAFGLKSAGLAVGAPADLVVLDPDHPSLYGRVGDAVLDSYIFAGGAACVRDVFVGGKQVVAERRHTAEEAVFARFKQAIGRLSA